MTTCTPSRPSCTSCATASVACITTLSVSSISRSPAGTPSACSVVTTWCAKSLRRSCTAETFTATRIGAPPRRGLPARLAQHPRPDRDDEVRLLGDRHEPAGHHRAEPGVLPAQERLDAVDLAGAKVELRLVEQLELLPRHGAVQVLL